jgi:hypothetical protein
MVKHDLKNRIQPISKAEIEACLEEQREVIGFSAENTDRQVFFKLLCRNGDIGVVSFDVIVADYLLRHLETVILGRESDPQGGSRLKMALQRPAAYGESYLSDPETQE